MNNKTRKQRLWKASFCRKYRQRILDTVERECGVPASCLCAFIAKMAERLSGGRLTTQTGIMVIHDRGENEPPLTTAHCWNVIDGQIFDLSPLADCPCRIQYLAESDGEEYQFYQNQTIMFGDADEGDLEADLAQLMNAFATGGEHPAAPSALAGFQVQFVSPGGALLTRIPDGPTASAG